MFSSKKKVTSPASDKYFNSLEAVYETLPQHFKSETPWTGFMAVKTLGPNGVAFLPAVAGIGKRKMVWVQPHLPDDVHTIFFGKDTRVDVHEASSQYGGRGMAHTYVGTPLTSLSSVRSGTQRPVVAVTTFFQDSHKYKTPPAAICMNWILNNTYEAKNAVDDDDELVALLSSTEPGIMDPLGTGVENLTLGWHADDQPESILDASFEHFLTGMEQFDTGGQFGALNVELEFQLANAGFSWLTNQHFLPHRTQPLTELSGKVVKGLLEANFVLVNKCIEETQAIVQQMVKSGEMPPD
jgi:hypothetical protein